MRKVMKIWTILSVILLLAITSACRTVPVTPPALPPKPNREKQDVPKSVKDYAALLLYYDTLVQQWELWGDTVEKIVQDSSDKK